MGARVRAHRVTEEPMHVPGSRNVRQALAIARDRGGMWICVFKHTDPCPVREQETDHVFLVYRNTNRFTPLVSLIPPQFEHTVREHI